MIPSAMKRTVNHKPKKPVFHDKFHYFQMNASRVFSPEQQFLGTLY